MNIFDQITGSAEERLEHIPDYTGYVVECILAARKPDSFHLWILLKKSYDGIVQTTLEKPSKSTLLYFIENLPKEEEHVIIYGSRQARGYFIDTVIDDKRVLGDIRIMHKGRIILLQSDDSMEDDVQLSTGWGEMASDYRWVAVSDNGKYLGMSAFMQQNNHSREISDIFKRLRKRGYIL